MAQINDELCRVYANLNTYKNKLDRTIKNVKEMLDISSSPYIAFSCGKDSSVLADIVLKINPDIKLRFISSGETRIMHNVDDVMYYFRNKYTAIIEEIVFDRVFSDEWKDASFDEQRKAGRRDIQNIDNIGYDGVFMGLRKEESRGRCISLKMHRSSELPYNMYKYKRDSEFYRMCPLADWSTKDIGAYIVTNNIPVLKWYEDFGFDSRTTARLTGDSIRQNTLYWIKYNNPAGYQKLVSRFPELSVFT